MVNVLPKSVVGKSRHGLVEVLPLHGLGRLHNFGAPKSQSGGAPQSRTRSCKLPHVVKGGLIPSCAQVEASEKSGEVTSPHPARFGRARLRATKRSALAAVAQHLLGPAANAI